MARATCTATSKGTGRRCGRYPAAGALVCRFHGGASPQARRKAAERAAEQEAVAIVNRMDVGPVEEPLVELKKLAGRVLAWEGVLAGKMAEIEQLRYSSATGEQLRSEVALVERAMDRCAHVLTAIAKLNLDDRLVRLEEAKAALVEQLILGVFADLGLTEQQISVGRVSVGRRLAAITA